MAEILIGVVLPALLIVIAFLILKLRDARGKLAFRDTIAWFWEMRNYLHVYIYRVIEKHGLPDLYCPDKSAEEYMNIIFDEYELHLCRNYFKNNLVQRNEIYDDKTYFFYSLSEYLVNHENDREFAGQEMLGERVSTRESGQWTYYTYQMTDFSIVYHKLLFISLIYCKNSKLLSDAGITYGDFEDYYTNMIQSGLIER